MMYCKDCKFKKADITDGYICTRIEADPRKQKKLPPNGEAYTKDGEGLWINYLVVSPNFGCVLFEERFE